MDKERSELIPLYSNANDNGALRLIIAFFLGFTITLTLALAAGIYYGKSQVCHAFFNCWNNNECTIENI